MIESTLGCAQEVLDKRVSLQHLAIIRSRELTSKGNPVEDRRKPQQQEFQNNYKMSWKTVAIHLT